MHDKPAEQDTYTYRLENQRPSLVLKTNQMESQRPSEPSSMMSTHVPSHATVPVTSISPSFASKLESKYGQAAEKNQKEKSKNELNMQ